LVSSTNKMLTTAKCSMNTLWGVRVLVCFVTCWWLDTGFGWAIGFMEHLELAATSNYNTIANSCTLLPTTAHTKSSQFAMSLFTHCLVMAFDSMDSVLNGPCPCWLATHSTTRLSLVVSCLSPFPAVRRLLPSTALGIVMCLFSRCLAVAASFILPQYDSPRYVFCQSYH
jgi:hypothetical protein